MYLIFPSSFWFLLHFRDTLIVCFGNCLTSVFAGFAIFSILGFLAKELGVKVEDVVQGGTGLAFIAYPDLVTRLPAAPIWAILFFAMLFTLGSVWWIIQQSMKCEQDYRTCTESKNKNKVEQIQAQM